MKDFQTEVQFSYLGKKQTNKLDMPKVDKQIDPASIDRIKLLKPVHYWVH